MRAVTESSTDLIRLSRQCWGMLETLHVVGYLSPKPYAAYAELGLQGRRAYFAARSAPLGRASRELVAATFYVFSPSLIAKAMPSVWDQVTPEQITQVRYQVVTDTLREILADPDVGEPLELAREACAGLREHHRPLFAAHRTLPWPDDPLMALFHASALVREHRGDAHMSALFQAGLDPVEALITGGLASNSLEFVRTTRGWTDDEWAAGYQRLQARGLVDQAGELTSDGSALRASIEAATDQHAVEGWAHLGIAESTRFRELMRPLRDTVKASGVLPDWVSARS